MALSFSLTLFIPLIMSFIPFQLHKQSETTTATTKPMKNAQEIWPGWIKRLWVKNQRESDQQPKKREKQALKAVNEKKTTHTNSSKTKVETILIRNIVYRWRVSECIGNVCVRRMHSLSLFSCVCVCLVYNTCKLPKNEPLEIVISYQQVFFSCVFGYWNTRVSTIEGTFLCVHKENSIDSVQTLPANYC